MTYKVKSIRGHCTYPVRKDPPPEDEGAPPGKFNGGSPKVSGRESMDSSQLQN